MSTTRDHTATPRRPPEPKATSGKTRRDGKTAKAPPGASDRGHSLDDANTLRRAGQPDTVRVSRGIRGAARAIHAARAPRAGQARPGAAMIKVLGYRHSVGETVSTMKYVLSKADRVENDWAEDVNQDYIELAEKWGLRDDDGRASAHILFSLPNQDPAAEWDAARDAIRECFPNRPYVCALHTDTDHPHVHVILRMRDYDGRKLRIDRDTLHRYRETLTRHGQERGIDVEARRYAVPTRSRNRLRVFSEREPVSRQLDRHIAVLQEPGDATPSQVRRACKAIGKHRDQLHDGHRRGLMRAVSAMEQHPTLQRAANRLCKVTFQGPRGDRFRARQDQRDRVNQLATTLKADPVFDRPRQTAPAKAARVDAKAPTPRITARIGDKEPPSGLAAAPEPVVIPADEAGFLARRADRRRKELERAIDTLENKSPLTDRKAIQRAIHTIRTHHDVMTDAHRTRVLDAGRQWSHGMYRQQVPVELRGAQRALLDALGRSDNGRAFLQRQRAVDKAHTRLETATTPRQQRRLIKQLSKRAEDLTPHDRARLAELAPGLAPKQARQLTAALARAAKVEAAREKAWKRARRPKTVTEALARAVTYAVQKMVYEVARDVVVGTVRDLRGRHEPGLRRLVPIDGDPTRLQAVPYDPDDVYLSPSRREVVETALENLARTPLDDGPAMRAAMAPLKEHQGLLKTGHRERLLELAATWDRQDIERNQRQQAACDRLQRRTDLAPEERTTRIDDIARAAAAQRRALHRHTAAIERVVCATKDGQRVHRDFLIERALRHLEPPPHADPAAARRAFGTLAQRRAHLTDDHRATLLRHMQTWADRSAATTDQRLAWWQRVQHRADVTDERKDAALTRVRARELSERSSTQRHAWVAARLIRHGDAGRDFVTRHRVAEALKVLATRTPPAPDARFSRPRTVAAPAKDPATREATIVIRKDVLTLNARQRAEARRQAAALRTDKDVSWRTRRQARKLARVLHKTASVEERAQVHLTRALETLARRDQARDRDWLHMRETFKTLHEQLTPTQRTELGEHAARMAEEPGRGRLAKALRRIADGRAPSRWRRAPSRKPTERTR